MKHRLTICGIFVLTILIAAVSQIAAAAGDLDTTFSQDGYDVRIIGKHGDDTAYATAIQPDGKIVVVGSAVYGASTSCSISRYNPDGTLDTSFDQDGKAYVRLSNFFTCRAVVVQSDGKIVAAGYATGYSGPEQGGIVRLLANGSPDTSFDGDGLVTVAIRGLKSLAVQADGRIIVGGYSGPDSAMDFAVLRYNTNGTPDTSFDGDGMVITSVSTNEEAVNALAIQSDGKIVAGGYARVTNYDFALVRYNTDGSLDTSFDGDGKATAPVGTSQDQINALAIQPDGKIVAAGISNAALNDFSPDFALARFNTNGSLDTTFDGDGTLYTSILTFYDEATSVAIQPDGKIVAAGSSSAGAGNAGRFAAIRYNSNGSLDTTFDSDGISVTAVLAFTNAAYGMAIQLDGRIVAAGWGRNGDSTYSPHTDSILVRWQPDGSLDPTFDGDGKSNVDIGIDMSSGSSVAIQPDNKIVVAGHCYDDWQYEFTVLRYNPDGSLDTSFGIGGIVITSFGPNAFAAAEAVAIQPDGKIVVGGYSSDNGVHYAVARYNPDGSLDTSFDLDGMATASVLNTDWGQDLVLQADGKIVMAARSTSSGGGDTGSLVRFNTDGSLDTSFDGDGKVLAPVSDLNSLKIQPDGKIVAAGSASGNAGQLDFAVVRYNADGSPDATFGSGGRVKTAVSLQSIDAAYALAIQSDGKLLAMGESEDSFGFDKLAMLRYTSNGSLDTSFDGDGIMVSTFGYQGPFGHLQLQTDGRILIAAQGGLVRFYSNGSLDTTYGTGGVATITRFGFGPFALDSAGRPVGAGATTDGFFAVGRVLTDAAPVNKPYIDFDGDGKTDISIFRPTGGQWWYLRSSDSTNVAYQFGSSTDKVVPADFTGDGKTDVAFWRPATGQWFILRSENNNYYAFPFGAQGDIPLVGDFDADGKADATVFRPSTSTWYIHRSSDGGATIVPFGQSGDVPVVADYDGDGKADIAIYRPSVGEWWIQRSTAGTIAYQFGNSADKPVPGDFTGDGKADVAIWRPSTGEWFVLRSENLSYFSFPFGVSSDIPAPGDYDGDGKFDPAVFRSSSSTWYINRSTAGLLFVTYGANGDKPLPSVFVP